MAMRWPDGFVFPRFGCIRHTWSPARRHFQCSDWRLQTSANADAVGKSLRELLREAAENDDIRAVVLRVDSGGGSALASEAILRELQMVRDAGKPVIVSMGGVAASGGYMISLASDEIWAHPTTVTGSIGVIAMFPNFGRLFERLGIFPVAAGIAHTLIQHRTIQIVPQVVMLLRHPRGS